MSTLARKRRPVDDEEESEPEATQNTHRGRKRRAPEDESEEEQDEGDANDMDDDDSQDQVVKKLVRYALACEFQRVPIKRAAISEKVMGKQRGAFKQVFEAAQKQLRGKFGMEMAELPGREKVTLKDKRAAAKSKTAPKPTASYILTTTLPQAYRVPEIITPSLVGSDEDEATYLGIYSVIISYITMSPGEQVPDHKLKRALRRLNVEENTPLDKTDTILQRMIKQGYLVRIIDGSDVEETIDWRIGPRGKVELNKRSIRGFVKEVYGEDAPEDLDKRLQRSLGMELKEVHVEERPENPEPSGNRSPGRRRRAAGDSEDDDD